MLWGTKPHPAYPTQVQIAPDGIVAPVGHQYPDRRDCRRSPTLALEQPDGARVVRATGPVVATLVLGGLHHRCERMAARSGL